MRHPPFRLHAITQMERHVALPAIERAILAAGGAISDYRQFSGLAAVLELEVPARRFAALHAAIAATEVELSPALDRIAIPDDAVEMSGTLRIEFPHGDADLTIPLPAVPG